MAHSTTTQLHISDIRITDVNSVDDPSLQSPGTPDLYNESATRTADSLPSCSAADDLGDDELRVVEEFDKSVPLSSMTWEAYELNSDWNKSLKGDHGILAALDLSLPLPICNPDISSPTKHRDILDIFGDVLDLPPLNLDTRYDNSDFRTTDSQLNCVPPVEGSISTTNQITSLTDVQKLGTELDRSNTLMTPQELERMPDQGLEFEQSVGPKDPPVEKQPVDPSTVATQLSSYSPQDLPIALNEEADDLTAITVTTSRGKKVFRVHTSRLSRAASEMKPVVINHKAGTITNTLVILPVSKMSVIEKTDDRTFYDRYKYRCIECDRKFMTAYQLHHHELFKHSSVRQYRCSHPGCTWGFTEKYKLLRHEKTHNDQIKVKCNLCDKEFKTQFNLQYHQKQAHIADSFKFLCEVCDSKFRTPTQLSQHYNEQHPNHPKKYICQEPGCSKSFHTPWVLTRHEKVHINRKSLNLVCPFEDCGKKFGWKSRYDLHMKNHTGTRDFKCDFQGCQSMFISNSQLTRHKRTHSDNKEFICTDCGQAFKRKDHLQVHKLSHEATKNPHACPREDCTTVCATHTSLQAHLRRHAYKEGRVKLVCPDERCEELFTTKPLLIRHINAYHPHIVERQYRQQLNEEFGLSDNNILADISTSEVVPAKKKKSEQDHAAEVLVSTYSEANSSSTIQIEPQTRLDTEEWTPSSFEVIQQGDNMVKLHALLKTEVSGRKIELVLPISPETTPTIEEPPTRQPAKPQTLLINRNTIPNTENRTVAGTQTRVTSKRAEKGAARTDKSTNELMCAKARQRQAMQKMMEISVPLLPETETGFVSIDTNATNPVNTQPQDVITPPPTLSSSTFLNTPNSVSNTVILNLEPWFSNSQNVDTSSTLTTDNSLEDSSYYDQFTVNDDDE